MRGNDTKTSLELAINSLSLALQQEKAGNAAYAEKLAREGVTHSVDAVCHIQRSQGKRI